MKRKYDYITVTQRDEGVVFCLPDGSSIEVAQDTIRRALCSKKPSTPPIRL